MFGLEKIYKNRKEIGRNVLIYKQYYNIKQEGIVA